MNLSHEQASSALQNIAQAQRRLGIFSGYHRAAPHLWLWGAVWMVGYAITDLAPPYAGWAWLVLDLGGIGAGLVIARRQAGAAGQPAWGGDQEWVPQRMLGIGLVIVVFIFATFDMMRPQQMAQYSAFPVLLMGMLYALAGLFAGLRWLVTGLALTALSLLCYHFIEPHTMLWLGVLGGGTLILSGFWMRSQ